MTKPKMQFELKISVVDKAAMRRFWARLQEARVARDAALDVSQPKQPAKSEDRDPGQ